MKPHVAMLAIPAAGHLIPFIELARRLAAIHNTSSTIFVLPIETTAAESRLLQTTAATANGFTIKVLPAPIDLLRHIKPGSDNITHRTITTCHSLPILCSAIAAMDHSPCALIVGLFASEAIKVADELGLKKYVYFVSSAWFLAVTVYFPHFGKNIRRGEPVKIPGCEEIQPEDVIELVFYPNSEPYQEFARTGLQVTTADEILVNTWDDLERRTLDSFNEDEFLKPIVKIPVHPIGPLARSVDGKAERGELVEWLDMQPKKSVVYVALGTVGSLSAQQTIEMAWGLELSQQRFIWVLHPPTNSHENAEEISKCLPDGFLDRTHVIGRVIPKWGPQAEIMAHPSVGAFVSHCGWNSVLESMVNGVPIIAWPLYAEQDMNSTMVTKTLGVGARPELRPSKGLVDRAEIAQLVKSIMVDEQGEMIRSRMKSLQDSAKKALRNGGSSHATLVKVYERLVSHRGGDHHTT